MLVRGRGCAAVPYSGTEVAEADVELAIRCLRATPVDVAFAPRRGNVHDLLLRSYADGGPERSEGDSAR